VLLTVNELPFSIQRVQMNAAYKLEVRRIDANATAINVQSNVW